MSGVYASQRLNFLMFRKTFRGKPGSERYSGNPTVADRRGARGNGGDGGRGDLSRGLKERVMGTLCLKLRAPQFYPDPFKCRSDSVSPRPATGLQGPEAGRNGGAWQPHAGYPVSQASMGSASAGGGKP